MKKETTYTDNDKVYEYPTDHFRVSHRELDLCHQISDESECNSSREDHVGGNKKTNWYDRADTVGTQTEIYHAKF